MRYLNFPIFDAASRVGMTCTVGSRTWLFACEELGVVERRIAAVPEALRLLYVGPDCSMRSIAAAPCDILFHEIDMRTEYLVSFMLVSIQVA